MIFIASAASSCFEKVAIASAPKNIRSVQISPMTPNIMLPILYIFSTSRVLPFLADAETVRLMATGSPAVDTMYSMAYIEYAALKTPIPSWSILLIGILNRTPIIFTRRLDTEMTSASATKLFLTVSDINWNSFRKSTHGVLRANDIRACDGNGGTHSMQRRRALLQQPVLRQYRAFL